MSHWVSEHAIMLDLSVAQGSHVPVELVSTVGVNQKPPPSNYTEETEESYFRHLNTNEEDSCNNPDLGLIQQMLEIVRDTNVTSGCDDDKLISSKKTLSPHCEVAATESALAVPTLPPVSNNNNVATTPQKKKKQKNVALNSILQAMASNTLEEPEIPMKLLKPTDFLLTHQDTDSLSSDDKVSCWLNTQEKTPNIDNKMVYNRLINFNSNNMFKRKSSSTIRSTDSNVKPKVETVPVATTASFRPSPKAEEYYQKYLERSNVVSTIPEDVWSKAERLMKELDEKKKALNNMVTTQNSEMTNGNTQAVIGPEEIQLPRHRHLLHGDCVVCQVFKSRGFDTNSDK